MDIDCDHTHLHVVIPQKYSVSEVGGNNKKRIQVNYRERSLAF